MFILLSLFLFFFPFLMSVWFNETVMLGTLYWLRDSNSSYIFSQMYEISGEFPIRFI